MAVFENYLPAPQARETPVPLETRKEGGDTGILTGYGNAKYLRAQLLITEASPGKYDIPPQPMPPIEVKPVDGVVVDATPAQTIDVKPLDAAGTILLSNTDILPLPAEEPPYGLRVYVEDSVDLGANWNPIGAFAPATEAGRQVLNITEPFSDLIRITWSIPDGSAYAFQIDWVAE